jgi:hypothetical protein
MTAAAFPWIFVALYFVYVILPPEAWSSWDAWKESLLAGRFAAPTSAGVLFSMLAAAGLGATWLFRKARILAIFDDLDTVLLMIPLKMLMVGLAWQLGLIVVVMFGLLWMAWRYLHQWPIPSTWPWVVGYAVAIAGACEAIYLASKTIDHQVPIHIEVLLPAFVLGCVIRRPAGGHAYDELQEELRARAARASIAEFDIAHPEDLTRRIVDQVVDQIVAPTPGVPSWDRSACSCSTPTASS